MLCLDREIKRHLKCMHFFEVFQLAKLEGIQIPYKKVKFKILFTQPHNLDSTPNGPDKLDNHDRMGWPNTPDGSDRHDNTNRLSRPDDPHRFGEPDDTKVSGGPDDPDVSHKPNDPTDPLTWQALLTQWPSQAWPTRKPRRARLVRRPDDTDRPDDLAKSSQSNDTDLSGVSNDTNMPDNPDGSASLTTQMGRRARWSSGSKSGQRPRRVRSD